MMNPHRFPLAILALGLGIPIVASAADTTPLSLHGAIAAAVAANPDLKRERARVASAEAGITMALGQFDLILGSDLGLARKVTPTVCNSNDPQCTKDPGSGQTTTTTGDIYASRALETGGQLKLALVGSQVKSAPALSTDATSTAQTTYRAGLVLTFTQPLLRGFGREIAEANLRKARIDTSRAEQTRRMTANNVLRDVVIAYWELAYATADIEIKRSALGLAREQLRITQAMIEVGRLAQSDSAAVERAIAQREEELALSELAHVNRSLDLAKLLGTWVKPEAALYSAADAPSTVAVAVDARTEIERALEGNPQLKALRLGIKLDEIDLAVARATLRPQLDFTASTGPVGRSRSGLGEATTHAARMDDFDFSAGLAFQWPVQNRAALGSTRIAEEALALARIDAATYEALLRDLVLRQVHSLVTTVKRIDYGKRQVEFAGRNLDAERARFSVGRTTNNEILLRQQELKDAETRLLRATVDQLVYDTTLDAVTATLLDRHGVVLGGW